MLYKMASPSPGVLAIVLSMTGRGFTVSIAEKKFQSPCIIAISDKCLDSESESEFELSDDCNDDPKFVRLDDKEVNVIISDNNCTFAIKNSAPLPTEVSCGRHNLDMHGSRISTEIVYS